MGDTLKKIISEVLIRSTHCSHQANRLPVEGHQVGQGVLLQRPTGSERIAEGWGDIVMAATDISVLSEYFSHDIHALVTSSSRAGVPGQAQGFFVDVSNTRGFVIKDLSLCLALWWMWWGQHVCPGPFTSPSVPGKQVFSLHAAVHEAPSLLCHPCNTTHNSVDMQRGAIYFIFLYFFPLLEPLSQH